MTIRVFVFLLPVVVYWPAAIAQEQGATTGGDTEVDRVVATLGDDAVTMFEVRQRMAASKNPVAEVLTSGENREGSFEAALDEIVAERLLLSEAERLELTVADQDVDHHVKGIMEQNGWTEKDFDTAVQMLGFKDAKAYREHARRELLKNRVLAVKVGGKVRVTDREVEEAFNKETESGKSEEEVHLAHIVFMIAEEVTLRELQELLARAERVRECAECAAACGMEANRPECARCAAECTDDRMGCKEGGEDCKDYAAMSFERIACACSHDGSRPKGGDVGFFARGRLQPSLEDTAFALKDGEVSRVVQSSMGLHILRVSERHRAPLKDPDEVKARVRYILSEEQFARYYQQYIKALRDNARVEVKK